MPAWPSAAYPRPRTPRPEARREAERLYAMLSDVNREAFALRAAAELVARLNAPLRRSAAAKKEKPLSFADLHLDPVTRVTRRGEREFSLTPTEFDLLHYLMLNPRHVLSRNRILERVWGYDFGGESNIIEVYIRYLRSKLEEGDEPRLLHTVRGVGYALREG